MKPSPAANPLGETTGDLLERLEIGLGRVGMNTPEQAEALLHGLDAAAERVAALPEGASRSQLESEFASIPVRLEREASAFVRDFGGPQALRQRRAQCNPPGANRWWYLDEYLTNRRARQVRRGVSGVLLAAALLALAVLVYQRFFAPDPALTQMYRHQSTAQDKTLRGDWQAALLETEQGLAIRPEEPALLVLKGVLLEQLERQSEAEQSFAAARALLPAAGDFLIERSQAYLFASQYERALQDAQQAASQAPEKAQSHILIGQAYEGLQRYPEAVAAYDMAFTTADANEQPDIAALARLYSARLMQNLRDGLPSAAPTLPDP